MRVVDTAIGLFASAILMACGGSDGAPADQGAGAPGVGAGESGYAGVGGSDHGAGGSSSGFGGALSGGGAGAPVNSAGAAGRGGAAGSNGSAGAGGVSSANDGGISGARDGGPLAGLCGNLPAQGTWEDITPNKARGIDGTVYNPQALMLDPFDSRTVWLGTSRPDQSRADSRSGLFKSTDCGTTWSHVNTGQNAAALDTSSLWSMAIDPVSQGVMYSVAAYGALGLFKSTNAGVDWQQVFSAETEFAKHVQYNFVGGVIIDPTDHRHLVVTSHGSCSAPYGSNGSACQAETLDSGATWTIASNPAGLGFQENAGAYVIGLDNWIFATPAGSTYRTTDHGKSWKTVGPAVEAGESAHHPLVPAPDGNYYLPSNSGVVRSTDQGASWTLVANTPGGYGFAIGGGRIYICPEFNVRYRSASLSDLTTWSSMPNPASHADNRGSAFMDYDEVHHLLFSSNFEGGLFRMVTQ